MLKMRKIHILVFSLVFLLGCKDAYFVDLPGPSAGYLVVEGFILANAETTIQLSRTGPLRDSVFVRPERRASVMVFSESGQAQSLVEFSPGVYSNTLSIDPAQKYRLVINAGGKEYVSAYSTMLNTPAIDSISWQKENEGLQFYVNAKGNNDSKYYTWSFDETWEINSAYVGSLKYVNAGMPNVKVDYKFPNMEQDFSIYRCWQFNNSRAIKVASTEKLTENVVYFPIHFIEPQSIKLGVMYSMLLKQYALSENAYRFLVQMRNNSEQLGTIFDAQPSEAIGNIVCTTAPGEIVIGYVEVTQQQVFRNFVTRGQVTPWGYRSGCSEIVVENISDSIIAKAGSLLPVNPVDITRNNDILTFSATAISCLDCTTLGTNIKPDYWPR